MEDIYDYALETHGVRLNSDGHRLGSAIFPNKECIIGMVISDHAGFLIWIDFDGEIRETKFIDHNQ